MLIAEIGVNHLGDENLLNDLVKNLINTDVDAITLQVREPEFYNNLWEGCNLKINKEAYESVCTSIKNSGKILGVALGDINYLEFFENLKVDFYKVIRNDINNFELIDKLQSTKKNITVSTGLSSDQEISNLVKHINYDKNFKLNHTQLSHNIEDCNLCAIKSLKQKYGLEVTFGNHCSNLNALYLSLVYEPKDIFFYVRSDKKCPDYEHAIGLKISEKSGGREINEIIYNLKVLSLEIGIDKKTKMINKIEQKN